MNQNDNKLSSSASSQVWAAKTHAWYTVQLSNLVYSPREALEHCVDDYVSLSKEIRGHLNTIAMYAQHEAKGLNPAQRGFDFAAFLIEMLVDVREAMGQDITETEQAELLEIATDKIRAIRFTALL